MNNLSRWLLLMTSLVVSSCNDEATPDRTLSVTSALSGQDLSGYAKAIKPRTFSFPADHNVHPQFKNEWWYFTGNLATPEGRAFGYQVTFFRIAAAPDKIERSSSWATNQIWMAHAAITDTKDQKHIKRERFARGAMGLAGNTQDPFRVWLGNWQLGSDQNDFPWSLRVRDENFSIELDLSPLKDVVLQGNNGLSQKSPVPGNASYYYSYTRLKTEGTLSINNNSYPVEGLSWFDREWGSSLLDENQSGWDWFSLQFDSGHDLMYYQLRDNNGQPHPNSLGSWVEPDSSSNIILPADMALKPVKWWTSEDGIKYPIAWELSYLPAGQSWRIEADMEQQVMDLSVKYWEGAVSIYDIKSNKPLGKGYLEMTGY